MREGKKTLIALGLAGLGVLFVLAGILRGEAMTVLQKATHICLECIGLG